MPRHSLEEDGFLSVGCMPCTKRIAHGADRRAGRWAQALLDELRLAEEGIFDPRPVRMRLQGHLAGTRNDQYPLWNVLMFQAWKERWLP